MRPPRCRRDAPTPAPTDGIDGPQPLWRARALWTAVLVQCFADAEGRSLHSPGEWLEMSRARSLLESGPERWPWPMAAVAGEVVPDDRHWRSTCLPRLRERWREVDRLREAAGK